MKNKIKFGTLFAIFFTLNTFGMDDYKVTDNFDKDLRRISICRPEQPNMSKIESDLSERITTLLDKLLPEDSTNASHREELRNTIEFFIKSEVFNCDYAKEEYIKLLDGLATKLKPLEGEITDAEVIYNFLTRIEENLKVSKGSGDSFIYAFYTAVNLATNPEATTDEINDSLQTVITFLFNLQGKQPILTFADPRIDFVSDFAKFCTLDIIKKFMEEGPKENCFYHPNFKFATVNPVELILALTNIQGELYKERDEIKDITYDFILQLYNECQKREEISGRINKRATLLLMPLYLSTDKMITATMAGNNTLLDVLMRNITTLAISDIMKKDYEPPFELLASIIFGTDKNYKDSESIAKIAEIKSTLKELEEEILSVALPMSYELLEHILVDSTDEFLEFGKNSEIDPNALFGFNTEILKYFENSQQCLDFALLCLNDKEKTNKILEGLKGHSLELQNAVFRHMLTMLGSSSNDYAETTQNEIFDLTFAFLTVINHEAFEDLVQYETYDKDLVFQEDIEDQQIMYKSFAKAHDLFESIKSIRSSNPKAELTSEERKEIEKLKSELEELTKEAGPLLEEKLDFFEEEILNKRKIPSNFISLVKMLYDIREETSIDSVTDLTKFFTSVLCEIQKKRDEETHNPLVAAAQGTGITDIDDLRDAYPRFFRKLREYTIDIATLSAEEVIKEIPERALPDIQIFERLLVCFLQEIAEKQGAKPFWVNAAQMPECEDGD